MHPRTSELLDHLRTQRAILRLAYDAAPPNLRELRPAADRWSIAGVIEHLALVERRIATVLQEGLRAALATAPLPPLRDVAPFLPQVDPTAILDRERRIAAHTSLHPARGLDGEAAWAALQASTQQVLDLTHQADGVDTSTVRSPHPVFGLLDFAHWITFIGYHEARHAAQIRATTAAILG